MALGPNDRERRTTIRVKQGGIARTLIAAGALLVVGVLLAGVLPSLNPFETETVDRSQPAVLKSIERLSEYRAATANLQVIVDIEKDAKLLPAFIKGEKVLLVAAGRVDAGVDFGRFRGNAVRVSEDRKAVTITLPAPRLSEPQVDLARSRVYDRDRGLFDRIESVFEDSPTQDRDVLVLAEQKLLAAARDDPSLLQAAEANTRSMLTGLMKGLGFERVTIAIKREKPPV